MPDFFLISGLFLARVIDRPWRDYLDRKVIHFAYFYVLWVVIQVGMKSLAQGLSLMEIAGQFALTAVQPFGTMWFIYLLPIFFVVTKLARTVPVWVMVAIGSALHMAPVHTGSMVIDEFASRYVFFYAGYVFAPQIFRLAAIAMQRVGASLALLVIWAIANGVLVFTGMAEVPPISLVLGLVGAAAVAIMAALLSMRDIAAPLRYCRRHSIVIYLAFFLPMASLRTVLLKTGLIPDIGLMSLAVTLAAAIGPLVLFWMVRKTPARFLFERPQWARLKPPRIAMQPAE